MGSNNIILIGMPGAGKSTTGVQLAKSLALDFIDTDLLIQTQTGQPLQTTVNEKGYKALRNIEEQVLLTLDTNNTLIATGGSAVYSHTAMQHLKSLGIVVFLTVDLATLKERITDEDSRGIARPAGQCFDDVFNERMPLYQQYADITHSNTHTHIEELVSTIQQHGSDLT